MVTVRGGNVLCDKCGDECKALRGFEMRVDRAVKNFSRPVQKISEALVKKYGQHDFVLCWDCTIQMMGIPTERQRSIAYATKVKIEKQAEEKAEKLLEVENEALEAENIALREELNENAEAEEIIEETEAEDAKKEQTETEENTEQEDEG